MISGVSEFRQDSFDLDENVPVARDSKERRNKQGMGSESQSPSKSARPN